MARATGSSSTSNIFITLGTGWGNGLDVPDVSRVFLNSPVAGELAHPGDVEDCLGRPGRVVLECRNNGFLGCAIGTKIREMKVEVAIIKQGPPDRVKYPRFAHGKQAACQAIDRTPYPLILLVQVPRVISRLSQGLNLINSKTEYEDVLGTHFFLHFNVCSIECADG